MVLGFFVFQLFMSEKKKIPRSLNFTLLKVTLPKEQGKQIEETRDPKELVQIFIGQAEQFFSGLAGVYEKGMDAYFSGQEYFSFEITAMDKDIHFYAVCPDDLKDMMAKQIHSFYHDALIEEEGNYNIFVPNSKVVSAEINLSRDFAYPLKTYKELDSDPINSLTNSLSKLGQGEGAAIQILVRPTSPEWRKVGENLIKKISEGQHSKSFSKSTFGFAQSELTNHLFGKAGGGEPAGGEQSTQLTPVDEQKIEGIREKISKVGFETNIRVVVSSPDQIKAETSLESITSSFAQFSSPQFNSFKVKKGNNKLITAFIFRYFNKTKNILNTEELASLFHFPGFTVETAKIHRLLAKQSAPPTNLPSEGILLGDSNYRGEKHPIRIQDSDRRRHIYIIGKTGTGKSTLLTKAINQDIKDGKGLCVVDPHGDLIEEGILPHIPKERVEDVILFDAADFQYPVGLNLFEFKRPEQKDFLIQELILMLYKLYDPGHTGIIGPMFEHWIRNAALALMADPEGCSIIDVARMFTDPSFVEQKLQYVTDPMVTRFWRQEMPQTPQERRGEVAGWVISKFGAFMTNEMMRNIMGQTKSGFDLREVMDSGKILLCNLSKGQIGELNSSLLGMILVSKIQMAAMSRADIPEEQRKDFYLYVDEFQNFATDSFASILSEARKYHLNLIMANQYIGQLPEDIRDAAFGNIGTIIAFTLGVDDAEYLAKKFDPVFSAKDLVNIARYNAYTTLLIDGTESRPFNIQTTLDDSPRSDQMKQIVTDLSRQKYAHPKAEVEKDIFERSKVSDEAIAPSIGQKISGEGKGKIN